ncbi:MAG: MFS transporter [Solirubrobacteraceae bacterium]|nr:MFS transporter [Solirubrobacteraceae bacterium]
MFTRLPDHFRNARPSAWANANRQGRAIDSFLEGPSFDRKGRLYVTDIPNGRIFRISPLGEWELVCTYDGWPNGLKIHQDGRIFITDYKRGLMVLDPQTGNIQPLLDSAGSEGFKGVKIAMTLWARLANRSSHRLPYVVSALAMAAAALVAAALTEHPVLKIAALCTAVASILSFQATFWAIPSTFLTGRAAAGGLAMIVSIGNLGGFTGPFMIGLIKDSTHSYSMPFFAVAAILLAGLCLMVWLGDPARKKQVDATRLVGKQKLG